MDNAKQIANQKTPFNPQFDPMKQPKIAYMVRLHQMAILTERLENFYRDDNVRMESIKQARSLLKEGRTDEASPVLQVDRLVTEATNIRLRRRRKDQETLERDLQGGSSIC